MIQVARGFRDHALKPCFVNLGCRTVRVDALSKKYIGKIECGAGRHGGLPVREDENKHLNDSTLLS